jgi:predicted MFS family arabinose efflux permease
MSIPEDPYATPRAALSWMPVREPVFFVVAPRKLLIMVLLTLGAYFVYWLYRQWALYRQAKGMRLWPWARVMFPGCYFCSLILSVMHELEQGESDYRWSPRCLAVAVFVGGCLPFTVLWLLSPFVALVVVACIAVFQLAIAVQLQMAINHLERDVNAVGNARMTDANRVAIAAGLLGWGMVVTGAMWGVG